MKFDEPNLVSCAGLTPVLSLAESCQLPELVAATVTVPGSAGANAAVKVPALVAGMVAGADCIEDMDLLRHGGMGRLFGGVRAPSTLGTFLRAFTFGHVRQLDAVAARVLVGLAGRSPLLGGGSPVAFVDVDDTVKQTYGYAKCRKTSDQETVDRRHVRTPAIAAWSDVQPVRDFLPEPEPRRSACPAWCTSKIQADDVERREVVLRRRVRLVLRGLQPVHRLHLLGGRDRSRESARHRRSCCGGRPPRRP